MKLPTAELRSITINMKIEICILTIIVIILTLSGIGCITAGNGSIDSKVSRFEESTGVYKVWLSDESSVNNWYGDVYGVDKDNTFVINTLKDAENNNRPVRITYKREMFVLPWEHSSKIIITDVKYID
jgi:hypothetical protein